MVYIQVSFFNHLIPIVFAWYHHFFFVVVSKWFEHSCISQGME